LRTLNKKALKIFILISVFFLFNQLAFAADQINQYKSFKPFKIAFIPDTHLSFQKKDNWILHKESLVIFQDVIKTLNKMKALDFIVFGGDLIDNSDKEFSDLPMLLDIFSEIKSPYYVVPGDRDADLTAEYTKRDFLDEFYLNFEDKEKTYWAAEPVSNVLLIGLDTTIINGFSGLIPGEQLQWLDNTLTNNKSKFTIIAMHHPAFPTINPEEKLVWKDFLLLNSADFLNIIQKHPQVKLVLSGHHHLGYSKKVNDTVFVSAPSIITYPNKYALLTVYPDKVEIENKSINYKQIIKKSKKTIINTKYAQNYKTLGTRQLIKLQKGIKSERYIFNQDK